MKISPKGTIKMKLFRSIIMILLVLTGCDISLNSKAPDYLKQFTAYKEGDGIVVYFILADSSGQMTTCDGEATISIRASHYDYKGELKLFDCGYPVRKENFVKTKIGMGMLERDAIVYSLGRISFQSFRYDAQGMKEKNWKGIIRFEFAGGGRIFKGEESFYF